MAAPTDTDIKYYGGADGAPSTDDAPYGGTISTGAQLDQSSANIIIGSITVQEVEVSYRGAFYRKNESTGSVTNARFYNRAGMKGNASSGIMQFISSSTSDTTIKAKITGYVASALTTETVTLTGQTPVYGTSIWDINGVLMVEILTSGGSATTPVGNITCSISSAVVGVIYGTADSSALACNMISSLYETALATSKTTSIGAADRLTDPNNIGSYYPATKWAGSDESIPLPGNSLDASEYIGVCTKLTIPAGMTTPVSGQFLYLGVLIGNATS